MKKICVITGGSGYIGGFLIRDFLGKGCFDLIYNFDLYDRKFEDKRALFRRVDVRKPIQQDLEDFDPAESWLFNLAALCREPGSEPREYFDTNVGGAETVTAFAEEKGFQNIFFTSTMSSYGRMEKPTTELARQYPETPYGISKAIAEGVHRNWLERNPDRRLIICRPSVIFGPGDTENIPRMLKAIKKGYFVFPGSPDIIKGYGYIYGLVESVDFVLKRPHRYIVYNYAERDCLPLRGMVKEISKFFGIRAFTIRIPRILLLAVSYFFLGLSKITGKRFAVHPVRVRKVGFPTNLQPKYLMDAGFEFRFSLEKALQDWKQAAPQEF